MENINYKKKNIFVNIIFFKKIILGKKSYIIKNLYKKLKLNINNSNNINNLNKIVINQIKKKKI